MLAKRFIGNTKRFIELASMAADKLITELYDETVKIDEDPIDNILEILNDNYEETNIEVPSELKRKYEVQVSPKITQLDNIRAIRNISAKEMGHIVTVRLIVTRISDIK